MDLCGVCWGNFVDFGCFERVVCVSVVYDCVFDDNYDYFSRICGEMVVWRLYLLICVVWYFSCYKMFFRVLVVWFCDFCWKWNLVVLDCECLWGGNFFGVD